MIKVWRLYLRSFWSYGRERDRRAVSAPPPPTNGMRLTATFNRFKQPFINTSIHQQLLFVHTDTFGPSLFMFHSMILGPLHSLVFIHSFALPVSFIHSFFRFIHSHLSPCFIHSHFIHSFIHPPCSHSSSFIQSFILTCDLSVHSFTPTSFIHAVYLSRSHFTPLAFKLVWTA